MAFKIKVGSNWVDPSIVYGKVSGTWRRVNAVFIKQAGTWRQVWQDVFTLTINSNYNTQLDVRAAALANGWNGTSRVECIIQSGVWISATGVDSVLVIGSFPRGLTIFNHGVIAGRSGDGGVGGNAWGGSGLTINANDGGAGLHGQTALAAYSPVTIYNHGIIAGGGGGGGGGAGAIGRWTESSGEKGNSHTTIYSVGSGGGGGGGGRGNIHQAAGGAPGTVWSTSRNINGGGGNNGNSSNPGAAGGGAWNSFANRVVHAGNGGNGGHWGANGSWGAGTTGYAGGFSAVIWRSGGAPGNGGACVYGNQNVTWGSTGERHGALINI